MKTYLVDFENVKSKGLSGIDRLTDEDHVIIFYSENSDTISFEMHCMVLQAKAEVDYMKVRVGGKNALDFQLSTLLGYLVAKGDNTHIFVISNDKGFDKLHDFWENTFDDSPACKVFRTSNISAAVNYARYNTVPVEEPAEEPEEEEITLPELPAVPDEGSYGEDSKVVEFDLAPESTDEELVIPAEAVSEIVAEAPVSHTRSYTEEQPVVKPITRKQETAQHSYMPSMPKVIAPGVRHPMLAADESQAELYEPLFEKFLRTPEAQDKRALLARFMPGADGKAIDLMSKLILKSTSKSELHNLLQQTYDNESSARLYNMVKRNYYFLKRVLREDDAEKKSPAEAKPAPVQEKPAQPEPAEEKQPENTEKAKKTGSKKARAEKPAAEAAPDKAAEKAEPAAEPRKATAELKKRLHELLDGKADADEFSGVISVINASATKQQLYINMMQRFKRGRGTALYGLIKEEVAKFIAAEAPAEPAKETPAKQDKPAKAKKEKPAKKDEAPKQEKPAKSDKPAKKDEAAKQEKPAKKDKAPKQDKPKKSKPAEAKASGISSDNADEKLRELCGEHLVDDLEFVRLRQLVTDSESAHKLYLAMIKTFGKKRGAAMYNAVKPVHDDITAALRGAAK